MLQVKNIRKKYVTGDLVQTALDDVSLNLRDHEFVAILGPSGSGKTTLLNVIGGLDRYDSGDLIINGVSTKKYTDRDWDSYRNHTVGFIFQSYNLIPHQTVLANVELALTISGISRRERRKRAVAALEAVGLGNQLHKKPNQMSGGQMQRVAIARALVNNPSILLADEPTGALDSDTSIQVMELLKEVSQDRLVVMVTHNPELAEQYASRIVRLRDGVIRDDSDPFEVDDETLAPPEHRNMGKASMSFLTALLLSFNNLWTKKARTLLTAFAGSIGIIGIALILSLSTGFQEYIDKIQEDTLSTYPLTIQSETADMTSMMTAFGEMGMEAHENAEDGVVKEQQMLTQMFAQIGSNDLRSFKEYLEGSLDEIGDTINALKYSYNVTPQIYSADTSDGLVQINPGSLFSSMSGGAFFASYMDSSMFQEMISNRELLDSQYDILTGRWPQDKFELVVVLSDPNTMSDYMSYTLGLRDKDELNEIIAQVMEGNEVGDISEPMSWTYDELMDMRFRLIYSADTYRYNSEFGVWEDMSGDEEYMKKLVDNGDELSIVGIVAPKDGVAAAALTSGVAYLPELTEHIIRRAESADIVKQQLNASGTDVFTGLGFDEVSAGAGAGLDFGDMISVDTNMLSSAFGVNVSDELISDAISKATAELEKSIMTNSAPAQAEFSALLNELARDMLAKYIAANADPATGKATLRLSSTDSIVTLYLASDEAAAKIAALEAKYSMESGELSLVVKPLLQGMISNYITTNAVASPESDPGDAPENTPPEAEPPATEPPATEPPAGELPSGASPEDPEDPVPSDPEPEDPVPGDPPFDPGAFSASISAADVDAVVNDYMNNIVVVGATSAVAVRMTQSTAKIDTDALISKLGQDVISTLAGSLRVDGNKIAAAFQFNMNEEELTRIMTAYSTSSGERSADSNLRSLGYSDMSNPTMISIYLIDFAGKERFLDFLDGYNADMEAAGKDEMVINYTDMTGVLMSSVKTIVDSVSYVLIAFVAVSLVVSSIMIGIITYISVIERTKEIGVLRAIGASKRNISQVFNAETFIVGLCAGLIGVGVTLLLIPVINSIIHSLIGSNDVSAVLPAASALVLTLLSMVLTIIGGLIPSSKAAKKDPVIALRSE